VHKQNITQSNQVSNERYVKQKKSLFKKIFCQKENNDNKLTGSVFNKQKYFFILTGLLVVLVCLSFFLIIKYKVVDLNQLTNRSLVMDQATDEELLSEEELISRLKIEESMRNITSVHTDLNEISESIQPNIEQTAKLSITSTKKSYLKGELIQAEVWLETDVVPDGVEFAIKFDPLVLSQVGLIHDSSFGSFLVNQVSTETGTINTVLLRNPEEKVVLTQPLLILKISATANQVGQTSLIFDREKTGVAAAGGQKMLSNIEDLTLKIL